ncbi:MAG TPA: carboxypeptidase-like regulatory domain-containing protein [Candidatus Thermoplasmatota archaeon]
MQKPLVLIVIVATLLAGCAEQANPTGTQASQVDGTGDLFLPGVVIDDSLLPIAGVQVTVRDSELNGTTDGTGRFRLGPIVEGSYDVIFNKAGFKEALAEVRVPVEEEVRVVLTVVASATPYYETFIFEGYYDCMIAAVYPTGNPTWPCLGIIDLAAGTQLARDQWLFPFTIEAPGFKGVLTELTWEVQPTASWMSVSIRDAEGLDETGAQSYFYNRSLPNLHAWAYAGQENPGGDGPFYPDPGATAKYQFTTSSASTPGAPVDFQFWLAHRSTLYATMFYHRLVEPEFSVLPDG